MPEEGVLEGVERLGNRLLLQISINGRRRTASLEWDPPPSVGAVETVLLASIGVRSATSRLGSCLLQQAARADSVNPRTWLDDAPRAKMSVSELRAGDTSALGPDRGCSSGTGGNRFRFGTAWSGAYFPFGPRGSIVRERRGRAGVVTSGVSRRRSATVTSPPPCGSRVGLCTG